MEKQIVDLMVGEVAAAAPGKLASLASDEAIVKAYVALALKPKLGRLISDLKKESLYLQVAAVKCPNLPIAAIKSDADGAIEALSSAKDKCDQTVLS